MARYFNYRFPWEAGAPEVHNGRSTAYNKKFEKYNAEKLLTDRML